MKASQDKMEAQINANWEERKARIEANQESMQTIWQGMEAWIEKMWAIRKSSRSRQRPIKKR
jgi:hypothetical protein